MSREFAQMKVNELDDDIDMLEHMLCEVGELMDRNTESSTGSCLLDGIKVLLESTLGHYREARQEMKELAVGESLPEE